MKTPSKLKSPVEDRTCDVCGKIFDRPSFLLTHYRTHTGEKPYTCSTCDKKFATKYKLRIHMVVHTKEKNYTCNICNRSFGYPSTLNSHVLTHVGWKFHTCEICGKGFARKSHVREHMLVHTKEKKFECEICKMQFGLLSALRRHMGTHATLKAHSCEICGKHFKRKCDVRDHLRQVHLKQGKKGKRNSKDTQNRSSANAEVLSKTKESQQMLKRGDIIIDNLTSETANPNIRSKRPGRGKSKALRTAVNTVANMASGRSHLESNEISYLDSLEADKQMETADKVPEIGNDKESNSSPNKLRTSRNIINRVGLLDEENNDSRMAENDNLSNKMLTKYDKGTDREGVSGHSDDSEGDQSDDFAEDLYNERNVIEMEKGKEHKFCQLESENVYIDISDNVETIQTDCFKDKRWSCEVCKKVMSSKSTFRRHIAIHENLKPFSCEVCQKQFRRKSHLREHTIVHQEKRTRNHTCTICNKSFMQYKVLAKHIMTHSNEKPHKCEICGKAFQRPGHVKEHMIVHQKVKRTSKRDHICSICGKNFGGKKCLKSHMTTHTAEKPHKCEVCGKSFRRKSHVKEHMRVHQGKVRKKAHVCEICNKSFSLLKTLTRHMKTHSTEKPHKCEDCGQSFRRKSHLKDHAVTHMKDRETYYCKACNKNFTWIRSFKNHMDVHENEKRHKCILCNKYYLKIKDHLKRRHKGLNMISDKQEELTEQSYEAVENETVDGARCEQGKYSSVNEGHVEERQSHDSEQIESAPCMKEIVNEFEIDNKGMDNQLSKNGNVSGLDNAKAKFDKPKKTHELQETLQIDSDSGNKSIHAAGLPSVETAASYIETRCKQKLTTDLNKDNESGSSNDLEHSEDTIICSGNPDPDMLQETQVGSVMISKVNGLEAALASESIQDSGKVALDVEQPLFYHLQPDTILQSDNMNGSITMFASSINDIPIGSDYEFYEAQVITEELGPKRKKTEESKICDICGRIFCSLTSLQRHITIHSGQKQFMCDSCGRRFRRREHLRDHIRKVCKGLNGIEMKAVVHVVT